MISTGTKRSQEASRLGVVLSAGGAAFCAAVNIAQGLGLNFSIVVDRACGAEDACRHLGLETTRIVEPDREAFSSRVEHHFSDLSVSIALFHFSRLVSPSLFEKLICVNVHPALLPAFPGMHAVEQAHRHGALFQGATLHVIDAGIDSGTFLAQTILPLSCDATLSYRQRLSFLQKVLLTLILLEWLSAGRLDFCREEHRLVRSTRLPMHAQVNPMLTNRRLVERFMGFQQHEFQSKLYDL